MQSVLSQEDRKIFTRKDSEVSLVSTDSATSDDFHHQPCDSKCLCPRISLSTMKREGKFTICEIRKHNHVESCWLVAGNDVYDATDYLQRHPAGPECILRKAGGAQDCSEDIKFHSKAGKHIWKRCRIGQVQPCTCQQGLHGDRVGVGVGVSAYWWTRLFQ